MVRRLLASSTRALISRRNSTSISTSPTRSASRSNLAAGAEYRDETFEIEAGQIESSQFGPLASQGFSAASNGFPGFSDTIAGDWQPQQLRRVWRRRVAACRPLGSRRRAPLGGLRGLRHDDERQDRDQLSLQRCVRDPRQLEHRFPRPDSRPVKCLERHHAVRRRSSGTGQPGHDSADEPGGDVARWRGARARGIRELQRRGRDLRARCVHRDG